MVSKIRVWQQASRLHAAFGATANPGGHVSSCHSGQVNRKINEACTIEIPMRLLTQTASTERKDIVLAAPVQQQWL
jgi:hypothetical protein